MELLPNQRMYTFKKTKNIVDDDGNEQVVSDNEEDATEIL